MPLSELELFLKYCEYLQINTREDLELFIKYKHCATVAELKEAMAQEYIDVVGEGKAPSINQKKADKALLSFDRQETERGTEWRLIEGRALRTYWSIIGTCHAYVIYFKEKPIRSVDDLEKAKRACVEIYKLLY